MLWSRLQAKLRTVQLRSREQDARMSGIEQFGVEMPDESRRKRTSLAGLEESQTANLALRMLCFAPLALSSGNAAGRSHRILTDCVLVVWWAIMQVGTAFAFLVHDGRSVIIYAHLGLLLAVASERARYLLSLRADSWDVIKIKLVGATAISTVDRPCDSEDLFQGWHVRGH